MRFAVQWRRDNADVLAAAAAAEAAEAGGYAGDGLDAPQVQAQLTELFGGESALRAIRRYVVAALVRTESVQGQPLFVVRAGLSNVPVLMDAVPHESVLKFFMLSRHRVFLRCDARTRASGTLIKAVSVNDLNFVTLSAMSDNRFKAVLTKASKLSEKLYPQLLERMVLLNVPKFFAAVWSVIRHLLPKRALEKVAVCRGRALEQPLAKCPFASQRFGAERLPLFLGGSCPARNGVFGGISEHATAPAGKVGNDGMTQLEVSSRSVARVPMPVPAGDGVLHLEFEMVSGGCEVSVAVRPEGGAADGGEDVEVLKPHKVKPDKGRQTHVLRLPGTGARTAFLRFDNTHSAITSKRLCYKAMVTGAQDEVNGGKEDASAAKEAAV